MPSMEQLPQSRRRRVLRACLNCRISKLRCVPSDNRAAIRSCRRCLEVPCPCIYDGRGQKHRGERTTGARGIGLTPPDDHDHDPTPHHHQNPSPHSDSTLLAGLTPTSDKVRDTLFGSNYGHDIYEPTTSSFPFGRTATLTDLHTRTVQPIDGLSEVQVQNLYQHFSRVIRDLPLLPPSFSLFAESKKETPVLDLSILTVAASSLDVRMFSSLDTRLKHMLADIVMLTGQKSIEIVYAFTLATAFYAANEPLQKARIVSLAAQAECMSSDLGLYDVKCICHHDVNTCIDAGGTQCMWTLAGERRSMQECYDAMYIYLACFWAVNSVMILFRRPLQPRYPSCVKSYVRLLSSSKTVHYQQMAAWVELEMIAAESFIDLAGTSRSFMDGKHMLDDELLSTLDNWSETHSSYLQSNKPLFLHYSTVRVRLIESQLAPSWNHTYIKPPYDECLLEGDKYRELGMIESDPQRAPVYLDTSKIYEALNAVVAMPVEDVRVQSIMFFANICYLFSILINNHLSQTLRNRSDSFDQQRSQLCDLLNRAIARLDVSAADNSVRLHYNSRAFRNILYSLRTKLRKTEVSLARQRRDDETGRLAQSIPPRRTEEQRSTPVEIQPSGTATAGDQVSEQNAALPDPPLDGWSDFAVPGSLDSFLAQQSLPSLGQNEWSALGFEELLEVGLQDVGR